MPEQESENQCPICGYDDIDNQVQVSVHMNVKHPELMDDPILDPEGQ